YIRYELYIDDEAQDVGIFQGICELDLDDDTSDAYVQPFDDLLEIPTCVCIGQQTSSWFTEEGEKQFLDAINRIVNLYDESGLFEVHRLTCDTLEDIVYQDKYQVLVKR
ncbi:MAG: hypothetical protein K2H53_01190, partial [Clostridia bacterium]|nr:hypothetical protein [Clostridia bacterium]